MTHNSRLVQTVIQNINQVVKVLASCIMNAACVVPIFPIPRSLQTTNNTGEITFNVPAIVTKPRFTKFSLYNTLPRLVSC